MNTRLYSANGLLTPAILFRAIPFAVFIVLLAIEPWLGRQLADIMDARWLYGVRSLIVAGLLALFWRHFDELAGRRPDAREGLLALAAGLVVLAIWLKLDSGVFVLGQPDSGFDPRPDGSSIDWSLALMRLAGSALVVPLMEELFWRSLVMRWLENADFVTVDPVRVGIFSLLFSSLAFGLEHNQWAAGVLAGLAYGWLYMHSRNLWVPIIAHAVTNAGLGIWVLATGSWYFW